MTQRIILAVSIVLIDWLLFMVPLGSILIGYIIIMRPKWLPKVINELYKGR